MKVILTESIRDLGKLGDMVNVARGYARNFLLPTKKAIKATAENISQFEQQKVALDRKNNKKKTEAHKLLDKIRDQHCTIICQSASDGRLFGSVNSRLLSKKISNTLQISLNHTNVLLPQPIKFNGVYEVQISLHAEVVTSIRVVIAKSESEAEVALTEYNSKDSADKSKEGADLELDEKEN